MLNFYNLGFMDITSGWMEISIFVILAAAMIIAASIYTGNFWIVIDGKITTPREKKFYESLLIEYPIWGFIQQIVVFIILYWISL